MSAEVNEPTAVIAHNGDENQHLSLVEPIQLSPGMESTLAYVRWSQQAPLRGNVLPPQVDFHAEGADWVYQYTSVGREAIAATASNGQAA